MTTKPKQVVGYDDDAGFRYWFDDRNVSWKGRVAIYADGSKGIVRDDRPGNEEPSGPAPYGPVAFFGVIVSVDKE